MNTSNHILGKILYALLFLLIIPFMLCLWAYFTEGVIQIQIPFDPYNGLLIGLAGFLLLLWGMYALYAMGNGLPMNAYPPPKFVNGGPYRYFKHPIYWGFGLLLVGVSAYMGSAEGFWLISPLTIGALIALVWGYERIDLKKRFPDASARTLFQVEPGANSKPEVLQRAAVGLQVLTFYLVSQYVINYLTGSAQTLFEYDWFASLTIGTKEMGIAGTVYLLVPAFILSTKSALSQWRTVVFIAMFLNTYLALLWPEIWAQHIDSLDATGVEMNSMTVFSTIPVFYLIISLRLLMKKKVVNMILVLVGIILILNRLTNSRSLIIHFLSAVVIVVIASNYAALWKLLRTGSERIANSWKEWTFGNVRVINHGFYVGAGAFLGIFLAGLLVGPRYSWALLAFSIAVIIFSALWAQVIEGSEKLKRPFGYYGALVGILFGSFIVYLMKVNIWVIIGVVSVVMPWVQAIGRLRCLINGCCHGSKTNHDHLGIRYYHFRSRVTGLSKMKGELLHPTQLYAIIWLFLVGFILLELWVNNYSYPFIFGLYLILTGLGRFVEEAYRGEIQTVIWKGLRLYQWTAIVSVIIGIVMTCLSAAQITVNPGFSWEGTIASLIGGFITFFAMGVDFPNSNARFSRLV